MKREEYSIYGMVLILVLSLGAVDQSLAQNGPGIQVDTELHYDNGIFHRPGDREPFTGTVKWYYHSGEQAAELMYREGNLVSRKEFYPEGNLMSELVQEDNEIITSRRLYRSGQAYTEYDRGTVKQWYESGQLQAEWSTDSTGILQGKATIWYEDGTLKGIEHYVDGELDGERVMYDTEGTLIEQAMYENGEKLESEP